MILTILATLAMAGQSQGGQQGGNPLGMFLPLIIIFVIFYFLLIRPQQKQQKKLRTMLTALKKGDQVITRGGVLGKITGLTDSILTLEIANNVQVKITRDAIVSIDAGN